MSKPTAVNIRVLDKEYTVACPDNEKASLQASAELLNSKIREIKERGSIIGSERIAVMAALNLAHELLKASTQSNNLTEVDKKIHKLKEKIDSAMRQIELT